MGQLVSKGDPYTGVRRHTDPPNLWLNVLTGSILLHALAILSVRTSIMPLSPPSTQAVPVDLIDVNPATVTASKSIRNLRTASKQGATNTLQPNIGAVRRQAHTPVSPSPSLTPFTRPPQQGISQRGEGIVPDGIGRSRPAFSPQPFTTPVPSSGHPGSTPTRPSPGPTNSPQGPRPTSPSPSPTPSKLQGGQGLAMTFVNSQVATGGKNIPDSGAKPKIKHQLFPSITYTAQTRKQFGKVVNLEVTITDTGQVQAAKIQTGSGDAEYDELVKDQLLNWEFEPALQGGKPVDSFLDISVKLDPR